MAVPLGEALLGATTFCAKQHGADECDSKGLPLTLNSTNIIGRFQSLKNLYHPHLTVYLDAKRLKNERMIIVSEWYDDCLGNHIKSSRFSSPSALSLLSRQLVSALAYLQDKGITHRALSTDNVLVTPKGDVKLHNYGLYFTTNNGNGVGFPIGFPRYMAPELIISGHITKEKSSPKVDVWSVGIVLLELFMGTPLYPDLFQSNAVGTLFKRIVLLMQNYQRKSINPLPTLLETHNCSDKEMNDDLKSFLMACLTPLPSKRPTAKDLLEHPFIVNQTPLLSRVDPAKQSTPYPILPDPFSTLVRCNSPEIKNIDLQQLDEEPRPPDHLSERPMKEVYYLWSLAGGDLEMEMKKIGLILSKPPIFYMPSMVTSTGTTYGTSKDRVSLYDGTVVQLSLDQLRKRLDNLTTEDYYPLLEANEDSPSLPRTPNSSLHESAKLPLAIKEKDVEYQFHRTIMFARLLESYPFSRKLIVAESKVDICPLMRGEIWAAILGVKGDLQWQYSMIDKDLVTATDRQIDVDIPRCHQYDTLLSSEQGHKKFKRILKSWVVDHPNLVYWQGLDSLCAPFLALNFNNEALAYSCLSAFIDRFLYKFFLKDNSPVMQEYLAIFSQLIAFHDPELYNRLDEITFFPELYAIPWFLTMFTHILPLDKIYHLWDTMLLGNCSFPIFVGLAILEQLREDLLTPGLGFNECILMFSDMPVIDIQSCIQTAIKLFQTTPISGYMRIHQTQSSGVPVEVDRQALPLEVLKAESCPQISAHDLIVLCKLESQARSYSITKATDPIGAEDGTYLLKGHSKGAGKKGRPKATVVDIRSNEEFRSGHVPHSINIPSDTAFQADGTLTPSQASSILTAVPRGRVIVIVGNKGEAPSIFGRQLVRLNFSKVCVLYGGAGVLRTLGILSSLQDDV